jgi:hypothetical protein
LAQAVGGYPSFDQVYTISIYSTRYVIRVFDITTNAFVKYYSSATKTFIASAVTYGIQYYSIQDNIYYSRLTKISYTDTLIDTDLFAVIPSDNIVWALAIAAATPNLSNDSATRSVTIS